MSSTPKHELTAPDFMFYSPDRDATLCAWGVKRWVHARSAHELAALSEGSFLVGALPFDTSQPSLLFEPEKFRFIDGQVTLPHSPIEQRPVLDEDFSHAQATSFIERVDKARGAISAKKFSKVVVGRLMSWTGHIDPATVHARLQNANPDAYSFYFRNLPEQLVLPGAHPTLVGASPELVLSLTPPDRITGTMSFSTHPLAGSLPTTVAEHMNDGQVREALFTEKNREEHSWVIQDIVHVLTRFTQDFSVPEEPGIVCTPRIVHLGTDITGEIRPVGDPRTTMAELLYALHPTPAVCGYPQQPAMNFLRTEGAFDRGLFSGVIGWFDGREDGRCGSEWAMTLRCGLVAKNEIVAFAGAGIISSSEPEQELAETEAKLSTFGHGLGYDFIH